MLVGLIPPWKLIEFAEYGTMHFVIPWRNEALLQYYRNSRKFKMLDNGAYEFGKPVTDEKLLRIAKLCDVDEIVLPDVLMSGKESYELTKTFLQTNNLKGFRTCAVPQGKDPQEFIASYCRIANTLDVDTIAIPVWLEKKFGARRDVIVKLRKQGLWSPYVSHHLLGLESITELTKYPRGIRSVDTSLPFSLGYHRLSTCRRHTRVPFDAEFDDVQQSLTSYWIGRLMEVAREV